MQIVVMLGKDCVSRRCSAFVLSNVRSVFVLMALALPVVVAQAAEGQRTSGFGMRRHPIDGIVKFHAGDDLGAHLGHPVYATGDGIVIRARWAGGYGNLVELAHGNGFVTRFGHLSRMLVAEGQIVRRGQMIGQVGSTGKSTGPHLHYEVRINGRPVDPGRYMQIVFTTPVDLVRLARSGVQASAPAARSQSGAGRRTTSSDGEPAFEPGQDGFAAGHVSARGSGG